MICILLFPFFKLVVVIMNYTYTIALDEIIFHFTSLNE